MLVAKLNRDCKHGQPYAGGETLFFYFIREVNFLKWFVKFYLDESGFIKSEFFTVGGFYNISSNHLQIQTIENKIRANILKIEKSIKLHRQNKEPNLDQYILQNNSKTHKEVKWYTLSSSNKSFLIQSLKNFGQQNVSIHCNLNQWQAKRNNVLNLDAIYNMMVYYLVDRTLNKSKININDEILVKVFIDQRKSRPKINNSSNLESLEGYINTSLYSHSKFNNVKVTVRQLDSSISPLIRYSDYYAGLTSSMCRVISGTPQTWDQDINIFFDEIHKKIPCLCHSTIKKQCSTITKLCSKCKTTNPI